MAPPDSGVHLCPPQWPHVSPAGAWLGLLGSESLGGEEEEEREREEVVRGCVGVGGVLGPPFMTSPPRARPSPAVPSGHVWPGWAPVQLLGGCRAGLKGPVGLEVINPPHPKPNPGWQLLPHQGQRPLGHLPLESGRNCGEKLLLLGD